MFSELEGQASIVLRIDDTHHNGETSDRFNRVLRINPGLNPLAIRLSDVQSSPRLREMDMGNIHRIVLFAVSPANPFSLYVDSLRLERQHLGMDWPKAYCSENK